MGLEELTFDVEGVKVSIKPELHKYHDSPDDDSFLGSVPVRVEYLCKHQDIVHEEEGSLTYDLDKRIFITALSDFVPADLATLRPFDLANPNDVDLLEKYAQGMLEVARVYSTLLQAKPLLTKQQIIIEKHFYRNSQGEWKDIGDWYGVESDEELRKIADAVK